MRAGARGPIPSTEAIVQSERWEKKVGVRMSLQSSQREGRQMRLLVPSTKIWQLAVEEKENRSHWTSAFIQ